MKATKQQLHEMLPDVATSAFDVHEQTVEGTYALATYEGGDRWDVWVRSEDLYAGLSERKLSAILSKCPAGAKVDRLTGEAVLKMSSEQLNAYKGALGIRKRRAATATL